MSSNACTSLRAQPYHPEYRTPEYEYTCSRAAPLPLALQTSLISEATLAITSIMKEMLNEGYDAAKANYVDAKMSSVYQEISKINIATIMKELDMTTDDYAKMLSDQASKLTDAQKELEKIKEENRELKITLSEKLKELKGGR